MHYSAFSLLDFCIWSYCKLQMTYISIKRLSGFYCLIYIKHNNSTIVVYIVVYCYEKHNTWSSLSVRFPSSSRSFLCCACSSCSFYCFLYIKQQKNYCFIIVVYCCVKYDTWSSLSVRFPSSSRSFLCCAHSSCWSSPSSVVPRKLASGCSSWHREFPPTSSASSGRTNLRRTAVS